jgi:invasion protein IalB
MRHSSWLGVVFGAAVVLSAVDGAFAQAAPPTAAKVAADEFAARGQREARSIKYGDWQKLCFKPGGAKMICRTTISGRFETGQVAVRVYVTEREGDSGARVQLFLPVGLYMPPGVKLSVDKGTAHKIPFTWCLTNTCIAGDLAKHGTGTQARATRVVEVEQAADQFARRIRQERPHALAAVQYRIAHRTAERDRYLVRGRQVAREDILDPPLPFAAPDGPVEIRIHRLRSNRHPAPRTP